MAELARVMRERYAAGSLGCFNPASKAGGVPSLHADGRAEDVALNANNPAERARGDALMNWLVANADRLGVQEILWRGFIWSCRQRHLGIRFGVQQAAHMNHVHVGVGYHTANNFTRAWLDGAAPGPTPAPPEEDELMGIFDTPEGREAFVKHVNNGVLRALEGADGRQLIYQTVEDALLGKAPKGDDTDIQNTVQELVVAAINTPRGQEAIRRAVAGA